MKWQIIISLAILLAGTRSTFAQTIDVEGQPLAGNAKRLLKALEFLGQPLPAAQAKAIEKAAEDQDAKTLQKLLDPHVLLFVQINPESRVKVKRGPAPANLQQGGYTPFIIKVHNESTVTKRAQDRQPAGASHLLARQAGGDQGSPISRTASSTSRCSPPSR